MIESQFPNLTSDGTPNPFKVVEVWNAARKLVEMTVIVWNKVKAKMLPTPAKFHYIFNLRDLSRVFQGIFMCPVADVLKTEGDIYALWKHEAHRVFADRLINMQDKEWFSTMVNLPSICNFVT